MAITGNLPPSSTQDPTTGFFDTYFATISNISQNVDDAVIGYFESITGTTESGRTLAASIIYSATQQGIDPMSLIDEFRSLPPNELNAYLTMFLNLNRANTSLLGLSNSPQTSKYVSREIRP